MGGDAIAGGTTGALQTGFNTSVTNAYTTPPKAAMVFEGDFVAGVILSSIRDTDAVARYGGDEFVIVLPDTGLDNACV